MVMQCLVPIGHKLVGPYDGFQLSEQNLEAAQWQQLKPLLDSCSPGNSTMCLEE